MSGLFAEIRQPGRLTGEVSVSDGSVLAVIGPNGSGKTTLVEAIAGTVAAETVRLGEETWTPLPPYRRNVGLVFQEHLLFPHLDARHNVAFGPRARGVGRRAAMSLADHWLGRLGLREHAHQRPGALSGGQAQRVALARALAAGPRVLLFDEPFAALDVTVAAELRHLLSIHLESFAGPTLLVTHDALDVRALADQVIVLEGGVIAQTGTPGEIAEAPATPHAARLLGLNVLSAADVVVPGDPAPATVVTFEPSAVTLTIDEPAGSARNRWRGVIRTATSRAGVVRVHLQGDHDLYADVTTAAATDLGLAPGKAVWASVKATEVTVLADRPT